MTKNRADKPKATRTRKPKKPTNRFPVLKTLLDQIHIDVDKALYLNGKEVSSRVEAEAARQEISMRLAKTIEWINKIDTVLKGITTLE